MNKPSLIKFDIHGFQNIGYISVAEINTNVPFTIKRVYWTYFTPNHVMRGGHAHKRLCQLIIAVSGTIEFTLLDNSSNEYNFLLNSPSIGLFIPPGYWRTIRFSHDAVMVCLASEKYDESDYIRTYEEFKEN